MKHRIFDVALVHRADAHVDVGRFRTEVTQYVDQDVAGQVLTGSYVHFAAAGIDIDGLTELAHALEKREGVRQEAATVVGQHGRSPRPAALPIQLDAEL